MNGSMSKVNLPAGADKEVPHKGQSDEQRGRPPGGVASLLLRLLWQHNEALQLAPYCVALPGYVKAHHMWHPCTVPDLCCPQLGLADGKHLLEDAVLH